MILQCKSCRLTLGECETATEVTCAFCIREKHEVTSVLFNWHSTLETYFNRFVHGKREEEFMQFHMENLAFGREIRGIKEDE